MLVLARKRHEVILIGGDIRITVVDFPSPGKVRIGIDAPKKVPVHRLEVVEVIRRTGRKRKEADS